MRIINLDPSQTGVIKKTQLRPERRSKIIEILVVGIIYTPRISLAIFMSKVVPARRGDSHFNLPNILLSNDGLHELEFVKRATLPGMFYLPRTEYHSLGRELPRRQGLHVWEVFSQTEGFHVSRDGFEAGDVVEECAEEYFKPLVRFSQMVVVTDESACIRHR